LVFSSGQISDIQSYVNNYRAINQSPPLLWDDSIYLFSQNWSNYMLSSKLFKHSGISSYGENIAYFQGYGTDLITLIKKSIDLWYNEIVNYDFTNPGYSDKTGHFTCLVWKSSTKFAMGIAIDASSNEVYITMNTSPPGNVIGQFDLNVLPAIPSNGNTPQNPISNTTPTPSIPNTPPVIPHILPPTTITPPAPIISSTLKQIIYKILSNMIYAVNTNQPRRVLLSIIHQLVELLKST
jgi:hypothetical protein